VSDISDYLVDGEQSRVAQSRRTRTPIVFKSDNQKDPSLAGQYGPGNPLQSMISLLPMMQKLAPKGQMSIYPNAPENQDPGAIGRTIRHEDVHALISQSQADPTTDVNIDPETLNRLAPYIKNRAGNPANELPAYAAVPQKEVQIPEDQRQAFLKQFAQQLANSSPKAAAIYKSIAGIQ
jgi:hypothetical protein